MSQPAPDQPASPSADLAQMRPGDPHYRAYVGPPLEYDVVGASQFALLFALGLRAGDPCLDLGCGSLRAGRLLIPYLEAGRYYGIEPNQWLIRDGIQNEVGEDLARLKRPTFDDNADLDCEVFGVSFRFIVAQSIFSHTGGALFARGLQSAARALAEDGMLVATFARPDRKPGAPRGPDVSGWLYPGVCTFTPEEVLALCESAGLSARTIPWRHNRQQWFVAARSAAVLPPESFDVHLTGATLSGPLAAGAR